MITNDDFDRINIVIETEVTDMFEKTLDFVHVVCPPDNWTALRSKILRLGNNCIRTCYDRIDKLSDDQD